MTTQPHDGPVRLVVINAGVSDPSSTRMLADRLAQKAIDQLGELGRPATLGIIDLAPLATDIAKAMVAGFPNDAVTAAMDMLAGADAVIAATPVYKAGVSGLFKSFIDLLDNDLLIARPVVLAATAGSARHAMVVDDQMRPLFAFMRALPVPTGLFAAPEDWSAPDLSSRIARAATELAQFVHTGVGRAITSQAWQGYQHQYGSSIARSENAAEKIDFDTDLMRLATGG